MQQKIKLTIFTDPMMGLSYESEPEIRRMQTHFGDALDIRYAMCVLVDDVRHFMISPIEVSRAFELITADEAKEFIQPLIDSGEIRLVDVPRGKFIERIETK